MPAGMQGRETFFLLLKNKIRHQTKSKKRRRKRGRIMPKNREGKTEEERLMLLQQRSRAEEEMKKKKEEILTLFLEDKLRKEEKNSAVNLLKLNEGWRSLLRLTPAGELRGGVEELRPSCERELDGLDSVVKTLGRDLQEAELQRSQVRRVHLQQAELLLALQRERVTRLQEQWEEELQQLGGRCSQERKQLLCEAVQRRADVEDGVFSVEQQHKAAMDDVHKLYRKRIWAIEESHNRRIAAMIFEKKEQLRKETLQNQEEAQICCSGEEKLKKGQADSQHLQTQTGRDEQAASLLQQEVVRLRVEVSVREEEHQASAAVLKAACGHVSRRTRSLRDELVGDSAAAWTRLTALTLQSAAAAGRLKADVAKGLKVLQVADMVRKLERKQDVFVRRQETTGPETEGPDEDMSALQQLRMRMNSSVLQRASLRTRRDDLSGDNRRLRRRLRRQMDAMTVSDQELGTRHALLTVQRAPVAPPPTPSSRPPTLANPRCDVVVNVNPSHCSLMK
ncbi:dynein regulatory complex subunit 2 isoform X2 [Pseudoliparis swirei]|uniref:dynein regulatory complex subunit 2 isoform X2 n=1 Tax=Pseudoliparis swirei TaxID=2059687 RepID=UPI0024BE02A6|nr:dynein regulatory complex subunit 2 isoform X2 [Pseudoliparis swirei]